MLFTDEEAVKQPGCFRSGEQVFFLVIEQAALGGASSAGQVGRGAHTGLHPPRLGVRLPCGGLRTQPLVLSFRHSPKNRRSFQLATMEIILNV